MKQIIAVLMLVAGFSLHGQVPVTNSYWQTVNGGIPIGNPNGTNSTITVSGVIGEIQSISVSLDITNGYNGDLYAYLDDPAGHIAVLLNRVGVNGADPFGYGDSGFNVTFTLSATNIHFYQNSSYTLNSGGQLTGLWGVDGRYVDPATNGAVLASTSPTATLDSFIGSSPDGDWHLFIADMANEIPANWDGWGFQIVTAPEPGTAALLGIGLAGAAIFLRRKK